MKLKQLESSKMKSFKLKLEESDSNKRSVEDEFILELKNNGSPMIEKIEGDEVNSLLTFIYVSTEKIDNVLFLSGFVNELTKENKDICTMDNIIDTNIWYVSFVIPNDIRFMYYYFPNDSLDIDCEERWTKMTIDQNNSNQLVWNPELTYSYVSMPDSGEDEYLEDNDFSEKGQLLEFKVKDSIFEKEREITVYLPHNYDKSEMKYDVIFLNDGEDYVNRLHIKNIFDNLIHEDKIKPIIGVLITSTDDRYEELLCNEKYCQYISEELLSWVNSKFRVKQSPMNRIIGGISLGGLTAAFIGLKYDHVFGKILSQSGSFWHAPEDHLPANDNCWMSEQYIKANVKPKKIYMDSGTLECENMMQNNANDLYESLKEMGHEIRLSNFKSGHDYLCWGQSFAEGLIYLMND